MKANTNSVFRYRTSHFVITRKDFKNNRKVKGTNTDKIINLTRSDICEQANPIRANSWIRAYARLLEGDSNDRTLDELMEWFTFCNEVKKGENTYNCSCAAFRLNGVCEDILLV
mmetsp:Transcript_18078/g.22265  ORF Transcript_18078/g.22265 Transcript_18078/m.22265 type:complete len:114 (+) Transcript_18078:400-741(+)